MTVKLHRLTVLQIVAHIQTMSCNVLGHIVSYFSFLGAYFAQNDRYCYLNDIFIFCGSQNY